MMEKRDYPRATIQFTNAVKVLPKDAEAHYQLAMALLAARNLPYSVSELKKAVDLNPRHRDAQLKLAEAYALIRPDDPKKRELLQNSQKTLEGLLQSGESSAEILDTLAVIEMKLGDREAAEKNLQEAFARFPKDLAAAVSLARVKMGDKDLAGAEEVLKKITTEQPPSSSAYLALGQFYLTTNKPADAEAQFRRAVEIDPNSSAALLSLAALQARTGKLDQADQSYTRLAALPEPRFRTYHAMFLATRGKQSQAIAEAEQLYRRYADDRAVRTLLVREYLVAQKAADADKLLTAVLKHNPKDFEALLQRSGLYLMTGRTDEAQHDLEQAMHRRNDSAEVHFLMAKVHQARGETDRQRQELGEALRLQPKLLAARLQLAQVLITSGSPQAALDLLNAREAQARSDTPAFIAQRNWALLALKQTAEARKEVDRGLAIVRSPELLLQDAYLRLQQKDYSAARAALLEALNRAPEDLRVLRLIAFSYGAQKKPEAGVKTIREYAAQHPKSAPVQMFFAELLVANGQRAEARAALLAAKNANPKFPPADLALAQLDAAEGHWSEALKTISPVVAQYPKNVPARLLLAAIQDTTGNHASAMEAYTKILEILPANVVALNNLAYDLAEYGSDLDEALKDAQKAAELAPDDAAVENTLGWVFYHKGLYSMALPHLEKAAEKEPSARHKYHLALVYLKMGDQERGEKNLAAALKLDPNLPQIRTAHQTLDQKAR
jgi:tetratricopeptide (TPR) repeat protein